MGTKEIIVNGLIQGVGFRWTTLLVAEKLNIKGYVQNCDNGTVLIHAQGTSEQMKTFIQKIKASPTPYAKIDSVKISECDDEPYSNFTIH